MAGSLPGHFSFLMGEIFQLVMPGLVPGIHVLLSLYYKDVDGRDEPGHDVERESRLIDHPCEMNFFTV
jgi:hypothetical protein